MEFLFEYGLFLAKVVTLVVAVIVLVTAVVALAMKQKSTELSKGQLDIHSLSDALEDITRFAKRAVIPDAELKAFDKAQKAAEKAKKKADKKADNKSASDSANTELSNPAGKVFVVDFKGSMDAGEVENLRREITAILTVATPGQDEVVVRLESPGGFVHSYGLAASQLQRLRDKGVQLTVCVDQVAASGGYMMACVANRIVAAPFAVIGSIGVVAQLPNFHKLLKKNDIEVELHTAGEYKRTLTMIGENTDAAREKFKDDLNQIHVLFKGFIKRNRESLDVESVATGETWYGTDALEVGLVDEIATSDDILLSLYQEKSVFAVKYSQKKNLAEKLGLAAEGTLVNVFNRFFLQTPSQLK